MLVLMSDEHNPKISGARRPSVHRDAQPRCARRARHALHVGVHDVPDLRAGARGVRRRPLRARDRLLGQRRRATKARSRAGTTRCATRGHRVVSIGKLHFRGRPGDDHGFSEEIVPMHIIDGIGDVKGLVRDNIPKRKGGDKMAKRAGPGRVAVHRLRPRHRGARADLAARGGAEVARPAVGAVRVVRAPHFPLTAPPQWFYRYWQQDLPMPKQYAQGRASASSVSRRLRAHGRLRHAFQRPRPTSSARSPAMPGSCRAMDENVGYVLRALRDARPRAGHARDLHERPRRQRRRARPVGQVDALRGERRRAADHGRPRRSRRARRRRAGVAHRLRADDPRSGRPAAARRRPRAARRVAVRAGEAARRRSGR